MNLENRNLPPQRNARPDPKTDRVDAGFAGSGFRVSHFAQRSRAFTLLEILIAVAIFAIILAAIHSVFYSAMRLRQTTTDAVEHGVPMQHALAIIKRDLANIVPPGGTLMGQLQTTSTNTSNLTGNVPASGRRVSPDFFTATGMIDDTSPWSEIQKVAYFIIASTNGTVGKDLFRSVSRNLLPINTDTPDEQPLLSGVEDVLFQFYDGNQWLDTWDSSTASSSVSSSSSTNASSTLPAAIRVQIELVKEESDHSSGRPLPIEMVVPVVVQARSNQVAQSTGGGGG